MEHITRQLTVATDNQQPAPTFSLIELSGKICRVDRRQTISLRLIKNRVFLFHDFTLILTVDPPTPKPEKLHIANVRAFL
jgi:hypothetical protein